MQAPFAAGIEQAVAAWRLEHVLPIGAFAGDAQAFPPESVQAELLPKTGEKPTSAPLAGAAQLEVLKQNPNAVRSGVGQRGVRRE